MARPPVIPVDDKQRIVLSVVSGEMTVAEAARRYKVSEQAIFRWKQQFLEAGRTGLVDGGRVGSENPRERMLLAEIEELKAALGEAHVQRGCGRRAPRIGWALLRPRGDPHRVGCLDREVLPADRGTRAELAALAGPHARRWLTQGSVADSGAGRGGGRGGREGEGLAGLGAPQGDCVAARRWCARSGGDGQQSTATQRLVVAGCPHHGDAGTRRRAAGMPFCVRIL